MILSLIGIVIFGTGFMYLSILFFEKCCLRRIKRIIAPIELDQADLIQPRVFDEQKIETVVENLNNIAPKQIKAVSEYSGIRGVGGAS